MAMLPALTDMRAQLGRLVARGFIGEAGPTRLRRFTVYLAALAHRREKLLEGGGSIGRDRQLMDRIGDLQDSWLHAVAALPEGRPLPERLREARWLLEEYRISLWAQQLGTAQSVSDQRIRKVRAG
jgi:ATP-dependent helicase HrpA